MGYSRAVHGHSHGYHGPHVVGASRAHSRCVVNLLHGAECGRAECGRPSHSAGRNAAPGRRFSAVCMNPNWARSTAWLRSASSCHRGHVLHVGEAKLTYCVAWSQEGPKDKRVPVPAAFPVSCWVAFGAGGCRQSTECRWCSLAVSSAGCGCCCVFAVRALSMLLLITTPAAPQAGWALLCFRKVNVTAA